MRKLTRLTLSLIFFLTVFSFPLATRAESPAPAPHFSTAYELIDAVNALRVSNGLAAYQTNSILMGLAQAQAEYLASFGGMTHTDAAGLRPFQRALAAGYSVAGDLSLGGWFSENLVVSRTAEDAVENWMGDAPHQLTMLSSDLSDVGVGVASFGDRYYYVLDCGRSTGASSVAYTPPSKTLANPPSNPPSSNKSTPTFVPNTPNADGSIVHIVQPGDTTLGIAIVYGISLTELLKLNGLTDRSIIYPEQPILIRAGYTPTPTQPTSTPTLRPTITSWPTSTLTDTPTAIPTSPPSPGLPVSAAGGAVAAIIIAALVIAGLITLLGRKQKP